MFKYCENQKFRLPLTIFQFSFNLNFQQYYKFCLQTSHRKLIISSKFYDSWSWFSIFFFWISSMLLVSIVGTSRPISFLVILIVTLSVFTFIVSVISCIERPLRCHYCLCVSLVFFQKSARHLKQIFSQSIDIITIFCSCSYSSFFSLK